MKLDDKSKHRLNECEVRNEKKNNMDALRKIYMYVCDFVQTFVEKIESKLQ